MKAILVLDMPSDCHNCPVNHYTYPSLDVCWIVGRCPLKPLPETKDVGYPNDEYDVGYGDGWDACLKEIEG